MGEGLFLGGQTRPPSQGGVALAEPQFCGFSSAYEYTVRYRTTKFGVVAHMGRGVYEVSHAIAFAQLRRVVCQQ